jgi:hypothetical protein
MSAKAIGTTPFGDVIRDHQAMPTKSDRLGVCSPLAVISGLYINRPNSIRHSRQRTPTDCKSSDSSASSIARPPAPRRANPEGSAPFLQGFERPAAIP